MVGRTIETVLQKENARYGAPGSRSGRAHCATDISGTISVLGRVEGETSAIAALIGAGLGTEVWKSLLFGGSHTNRPES